MTDVSARLASLSPARRALLLERLASQGHLAEARAPIPRGPRRAEYPLSFAQRRIWFFERLVPGTPAYHVRHGFRLRGPLNLDALEAALRAVVVRHASLRTTFHELEGEPVQRVLEEYAIRLTRREMPVAPPEGTEAAIREALRTDAASPFSLSAAPPIRALVLRVGPDDHVLALTFHHLITDGWSLAVLDRDLAEFYNASVEGREPRLPVLPIDHVDYVDWELREAEGPRSRAHVQYWVQQLAGAPPLLDLPTDRRRPATPEGEGHQVAFAVPATVREGLDGLCRRARATTFVALTAAWAALLHRYGCGDDLVVGAPFSGRGRAETADVVGCFVNTLGLRVNLAGDPTFDDLVRQVSGRVVEALPHEDVPFETVLAQLPPRRTVSQTPIFQTVLAYLDQRSDQLSLRGVRAEPCDPPGAGAHFDTTLSINETATGLAGELALRSDLFDLATGTRLVAHFLTLLDSAVRNPGSPVSRLPLLSDEDRQLVVREWNRTSRPCPDSTVHALFEEAARRVPDRVALVEQDRRVTYRELDERAERVAGALEAAGVGRGAFVGLLCGRSIDLIAAMLGVLKAGAAYLPLDVAEPDERLARMLHDVQPAAVLTPAATAARVSEAVPLVLALEDALAHAVRRRCPGDLATPGDVAYAMFTSGSTGKPKAVAIPHRGIVRLLFGVDYAMFGPHETFLHMAAPTFDASTFEIWGALLHGATCVVLPQRKPTLAEIAHAIRTHNVTTAWLTTSLFNVVIDEDPELLQPLRQLLVGGEALSVDHVVRAASLLPSTQLVNGYGPTESTTFACCHQIARDVGHERATIPIGRPIANTEAYVLDEHLVPTPVGVPGELYLGGAGLARGYVNAPDLTAARFIPHPFRDDPSARLYRTGDLARWLPDGTLEFRGRRDQQVKIRGFRVELGEIEQVLAQHPDVARAVVTAFEPRPGDTQVAAFVVARAGAVIEPSVVEAFARRRLPDYMVPSRILPRDALPVNASGKLDRGALAVPPGEERVAEVKAATLSELEAGLLALWRDLLGAPLAGPDDDFFELGGHSLLATRLLLRAERAFGRRVSMKALFQAPTVRQFAALLREQRPVIGQEGPPLS